MTTLTIEIPDKGKKTVELGELDMEESLEVITKLLTPTQLELFDEN